MTNEVALCVSENEARELYRHLHQLPQGQETYFETYRQLQRHFFQTLTVDQLTALLEGPP